MDGEVNTKVNAVYYIDIQLLVYEEVEPRGLSQSYFLIHHQNGNWFTFVYINIHSFPC